jgi:hypothetical protein
MFIRIITKTVFNLQKTSWARTSECTGYPLDLWSSKRFGWRILKAKTSISHHLTELRGLILSFWEKWLANMKSILEIAEPADGRQTQEKWCQRAPLIITFVHTVDSADQYSFIQGGSVWELLKILQPIGQEGHRLLTLSYTAYVQTSGIVDIPTR